MALAGREIPPAVLTAIRPGSDDDEIPIRAMKQVPGPRRLRGMHAPIQPIATAALRRIAMVIFAVVLIFVLFPAVLAIQAAAR